MSYRDDLATIAADVIWRIHGPESTDRESAEADGQDIADAILAAGYREPARTVSTVEELEATPVGTVLFSTTTRAAYEVIDSFGIKLRTTTGAHLGKAWWPDFFPMEVLAGPQGGA